MKKPKLARHHQLNREKRHQFIQSKWGSLINKLLLDGKTIGDICSATGKGPIPIRKYLIWAGLYKKSLENWKIKKQQLARNNGKCSSKSLTGVPLKPITKEIMDWFTLQIQLGRFKTQVENDLKAKFGFGNKKYRQLCSMVGEPKENPQTGELNPMYGKSPGKNSGIGVKGWVYIDGNKLFFRSSLELKIYLYLESQKIHFLQSMHRIPYLDNGTNKTYCPDIVIDTTICEIKPSALVSTNAVQLKFSALQKYCLEYNMKCAFITELTYPLPKLTIETINSLIDEKKLMIDYKNYNKIMRYL
jgi:hypothetical protein